MQLYPFAFATALERHLGWRYAVPAYTFASYVAISRVPADRHWLSDAVFGSVVGIIAGRTVTGQKVMSRDSLTIENDDLRWPHRDGLIWPHFSSVVVGLDVA